MLPTSPGGSTFTVTLESEQDIHRFVVDLAGMIVPGDLITLSGDLGAGKTTFARALIRYLAADETIAVPSPTFTLIQSYSLPLFPLVHADLYRLSGSSELAELGFDDLPESAVVLLEWPDRAAGYLPADRIDIAFTLAPQHGLEYRNVRVTGYGKCAARTERIGSLRRFLQRTGFAGAERSRMQGDASTRSYERLTFDERSTILMNSPRRADGPPIRDDKSYSAIAHLAEDVKPFVALAAGLRERGFSAPDIYESDLENGFLILEDLGSEQLVQGDPPRPNEERYNLAMEALLSLHAMELPDTLNVAPGIDYTIPPYDMDAFLIETELLLDWYIPRFGVAVADSARQAFLSLWREALLPVVYTDKTWVLRDFHSPNLLWLRERSGIAKIGMLDFQDALMGPSAYDLASLLQDARIDVPEDMELAMLSRYTRSRRGDDMTFDTSAFTRIYSTVAAQRATKILGIFARLDRRDGKPQYLRHIPRVWGYLQRTFAHPSLAGLNFWYQNHVPKPPTN
jgi:tRNA threonylcarbamoyl adenosine modification protein YjeE